MEEKREIKRAYYHSGALKAEWHYRNNRLDGICKFYSEKGKVWATEKYKDGKRLSVVVEYL